MWRPRAPHPRYATPPPGVRPRAGYWAASSTTSSAVHAGHSGGRCRSAAGPCARSRGCARSRRSSSPRRCVRITATFSGAVLCSNPSEIFAGSASVKGGPHPVPVGSRLLPGLAEISTGLRQRCRRPSSEGVPGTKEAAKSRRNTVLPAAPRWC